MSKTIFEEIITELYEASKKLKIKDISEILKKYKKGKEEDLRDMLMSWNINFNMENFDDLDEDDIITSKKKKEVKKEPYFWFKISNHSLPLYLIYSISKEEIWDYERQKTIYSIVLNKGIETKNAIIRDVIIEFEDCESRDNEILSLEERLEGFNIKFVYE